jgi:hypothetical protein
MDQKKVLVVGHLGDDSMGRVALLHAIEALESQKHRVELIVAKEITEKVILPIKAPIIFDDHKVRSFELSSGRAKRRERRKQQRKK